MQIQDAAIFAGDRLRIGPYELEVLPTVAKVNERKSTPNKETVPTSNAGIPTADAKYSVDGDPPSLGDLASLIEIRIKRIESQLAALQELEGGQATTWAPKSEEIRLAQQAIASLSQQLDCERERNGISFESLVAERDRLASKLADATKTASDLCRELEQVRSEQVENDAAADLYSQRIDEVSDVHAQRIAEVSELSAQRIDEVAELQEQRFAEISAEVDRLAEKITETDRHHQQACDRWQTSNDDLEQPLTNGVSQLTQLEEQLDLVRSNHEDTEAQRQLQGAQSEEIQESVRALKEQLSEQQSQQDELQAKWVTEHQELHDKFQHLEELHHQAITLRAAEPTRSSQPAPTAVVAPTVTPAYEPEPGTGTLSVDDLDDNARPEPEVSNGPLQWEDENPEEEQNQIPLSRLDQLRASRVVAEMQSQVDEVNASRPNDAFNDIKQQSRQQSQAGNEPESNPLDACLEMTSQDRNLDSQTDTDDQFNEGPMQPAVSDRDRMFDLLQAPNDGLPDETTVEAQPFDVDRTSPQMGSDLPAGEASPDNISALATGTSGPPNATGVPSLGWTKTRLCQ
jgi:hypothetical protein